MVENIRFFREFAERSYVSENGNITLMGSEYKFYVFVYIHRRGKEFMELAKSKEFKFSDLNVDNMDELMDRIKYEYNPEIHRHVLMVTSHGTLMEFFHDSEMFRRLKM